MTAKALPFWQQHARQRQTIIYAVSVGHAHNLAAVFNDAGIPAALMLGDTPPPERARLIAEFKNRTLIVLVNVAVATEGFDLPDASCVILARPTKSLALYLQMIGRGLRPKKEDDGDCVLLDLAANSETYGLPEEDRAWSLTPRGEQAEGEAPVVWCPQCGTVSHAANHHCPACGAPFGKECGRCGKWRSWKRWRWETVCGEAHDLVCDLCHEDAHVQATLPDCQYAESEEAEERPRLQAEMERRRQSLQDKIATRETALADDAILDDMFADYLDGLPARQRPKRRYENNLLYTRWIQPLSKECAAWKTELTQLESLSEEDSLSRLPARPANKDKGSVPLPDPAKEKRRFLADLEKEYVAGNFMPTLESIRAFLKAEGSHDQVRSRRYARNTVMRYLEHRDLKDLYEFAPAKTFSGIAEAIENAADRKRRGAAAPQKAPKEAPKEAARRRNSSKKLTQPGPYTLKNLKTQTIIEGIHAVLTDTSRRTQTSAHISPLVTDLLRLFEITTRGESRMAFTRRVRRIAKRESDNPDSPIGFYTTKGGERGPGEKVGIEGTLPPAKKAASPK